MAADKVNILLVDDQPAKLLSYEVILGELKENLISASSAREALEQLLKVDCGVVLIDVCMPELDGFELAALIRGHPRFERIPLIFVSAIQVTDLDRLRGYAAGAVDYVPVPVVPEVLRAKVRIFAELHRKTRQLERMNDELERRVAARTAELEASNQRLLESERRRSLALAAGRMGSWDIDLETGEVDWDAGQYRLFGLAAAVYTPTGETWWSLLEPADHERLDGLMADARAHGTPFDVELRTRLLDGRSGWIRVAGAPTLDQEGKAVRLSGVALDITERKSAEADLHRLNEELEQRIELRTREREEALAQLFEAQKLDTIGQLTGGVAHDFNNLLMAILGSLELLRKRVPEGSPLIRLIDNATQGAVRGKTLTQRLLAFARRQELRPEAVQLTRLVADMDDLLKRALGPSVELDRRLAPDVALCRVDANQLELSILNLVLNARDAMPDGGRIVIEAGNAVLTAAETTAGPLAGLPPGPFVRIRVADNGSGMDEVTLARATEPFFTTKGLGKGTGLGLSMVHGLAAQSGGRLVIRSKPGIGTEVILYLPTAKAEEESAAPAPALAVRAGGAAAAGHTVLLVDDDPLVRSGTSAMLEDLGHRVIECPSADRALDVMRSATPVDVVVTDHAMPGMSGRDLVRVLRAHYPAMPVILATGYSDHTVMGDADPSVVRLSKPYSSVELATAIQHAQRLVSLASAS